MGIVAAAAGLLGTYLGGVLADWARRRSPRGRLYVSLVAMIGSVPIAPIMFAAPTLEIMLAWWLLLGTIVTAWLAGIAAATQELVLPRMRGIRGGGADAGDDDAGLRPRALHRRPDQRRHRRSAPRDPQHVRRHPFLLVAWWWRSAASSPAPSRASSRAPAPPASPAPSRPTAHPAADDAAAMGTHPVGKWAARTPETAPKKRLPTPPPISPNRHRCAIPERGTHPASH